MLYPHGIPTTTREDKDELEHDACRYFLVAGTIASVLLLVLLAIACFS